MCEFGEFASNSPNHACFRAPNSARTCGRSGQPSSRAFLRLGLAAEKMAYLRSLSSRISGLHLRNCIFGIVSPMMYCGIGAGWWPARRVAERLRGPVHVACPGYLLSCTGHVHRSRTLVPCSAFRVLSLVWSGLVLSNVMLGLDFHRAT